MRFKKKENTYIIRLERGEKIIESVKSFCTENNIKCGYFFGIGALDEAELAHYIVDNKKYTSRIFKQPLEIANLTGNITSMQNKVYLHCHITLGDEEMRAISGHLKEGNIAATCEIILVKLDMEINRKHDDFIGLNLLNI